MGPHLLGSNVFDTWREPANFRDGRATTVCMAIIASKSRQLNA
jgi:hypothetical protein